MARKQPGNRKALHIRTGDDVIVLSGASKSATPRKVLGVFTRENKVLVEGVNIMKDRQRPKAGGRSSGINSQETIEKPFPIHRSKVALIDPKSKKATRVKITTQADGKRVRTAVKSGEAIGK